VDQTRIGPPEGLRNLCALRAVFPPELFAQSSLLAIVNRT